MEVGEEDGEEVGGGEGKWVVKIIGVIEWDDWRGGLIIIGRS